MGPKNNHKGEVDPEAEKQVDAFLRLINARLGTDEDTLRKVVDKVQSNGKHVTWVWIVGLLLAALTALLMRAVTQMDDKINFIEVRQQDVRERLRLLEEQMRRIMHTVNP